MKYQIYHNILTIICLLMLLPVLSKQYVVDIYLSDWYKSVTIYDNDFYTLQNNWWLNETLIDAFLLNYVTKNIGCIPLSVCNSIWSCTRKMVCTAKFD